MLDQSGSNFLCNVFRPIGIPKEFFLLLNTTTFMKIRPPYHGIKHLAYLVLEISLDSTGFPKVGMGGLELMKKLHGCLGDPSLVSLVLFFLELEPESHSSSIILSHNGVSFRRISSLSRISLICPDWS